MECAHRGRVPSVTVRSAKTFVVEVSPMVLPAASALRREPPRPAEHRQAAYERQFDDVTLFYDVFRVGRRIRMVGPPLFNLEQAVVGGLTASNRPATLHTTRLDRVQRSSVNDRRRKHAAVEFAPDAGRCSAIIGADLAPTFRGRKVLLTLSRDNDLEWIRDWARFHARLHGIDAVLLYDNGSTAYPICELRQALEDVTDLDIAAIVRWPFKYGPLGGPAKHWDSDFCQYGALEHAKWRLLRSAAGVVNADIDELVLSPAGRTVFDYARSNGGLVLYSGTYIEAIADGAAAKSCYGPYAYQNAHQPPCPKKWCLLPARVPARAQWRVHVVTWRRRWKRRWRRHERPTPLSYRHFKAINTGWQFPPDRPAFDPSIHQLDADLRQALTRVGM